MTPSFFLASVSVSLWALSIVLIVLLVAAIRVLSRIETLSRRLDGDLGPLIRDIRAAAENVAEASESLRTGMRRMGCMAEAVGGIGDDLEKGRQEVRGGFKFVGDLFASWRERFRP